MRFTEIIFALVSRGYRLEFERRLFVHSELPMVEVVVYNEGGELVSSIQARNEDELTAFLANTWRIEGRMPETTFTLLLRELMGDETQTQFGAAIDVLPPLIGYLLMGEWTPGMKVVRNLMARFPGRRGEILDAAVDCVRMVEETE